jgi:hypothetical protein
MAGRPGAWPGLSAFFRQRPEIDFIALFVLQLLETQIVIFLFFRYFGAIGRLLAKRPFPAAD